MTKKFVIDSCVFMKLFLNEEDDKIAENLIAEIVENRGFIYVPSIFIYEVSSITAAKNIDEKQVFEILEEYRKSSLKVIDLNTELLTKSIIMAKTGNKKSGYPSLYDCSYHALAIEENCTFITSDIKHHQKTKKFGHIKLLKDYE